MNARPGMQSSFALARTLATAIGLGTGVISCGRGGGEPSSSNAVASQNANAKAEGTTFTVRDTVIATTLDATATVEPWQRATLSTKLVGSVLEVMVHEGDQVRAGQVLVRLDARDLTAKSSQTAASVADAQALQQEAQLQAARLRALYADSAATRAQLDAAETGVARANAGVTAARAMSAELDALRSYATVRAPFGGTVVTRSVDPGAFASPGAPLLTIWDDAILRLRGSVSGDAARGLRSGQKLSARIDGHDATVVIEGVVPGGAGNLFTVNARLANPTRSYRAGAAATVQIPLGTHHTLLIPASAVVRDGDLTGVTVRATSGDERRWVRLGATVGEWVEVTGGLRAAEVIVVPDATARIIAPAPGA